MAKRRLIIAGTGSGVGKTTVTLGVMAALRARGLTVQGFKCGPDYIDPTYHTAVTGRHSRNLDSWMTNAEAVREIYSRAAADADIAVIEGVMGFYDGKDPLSNTGSAAEISLLLDSPVLLVVNCQSMARSAAAIVKGFQALEPRARIAGVFANKVGSEGHYNIVRAAIEQECGVPVVGYMTRDEAVAIPERHLGLVPSVERGELDGLFSRLGELIGAKTDLDRLLAIAEAPPVAAAPRLFAGGFEPDTTGGQGHSAATAEASCGRPVIAVARDAAFHFYYPENLELLEASGARLQYFSPLAGETVPDEASGLYLGGGFPEEFAAVLTGQSAVLESVRSAIERGLPTLAECGGFMFLTGAIVTTDGTRYSMAGLLPGEVRMQKKLAALGYREVQGQPGNFLLGSGLRARGHEFHYSTYHGTEDRSPLEPAYHTTGLRGSKPEGMLAYRLVAGYTHLYFPSDPELAARWVEACREFKAGDTSG
ncbi:cobyrinate a,c-diamide synthase [Paenibacillus sp. y28]